MMINCDIIWGINRGLTLNLNFITPEGTSVCDFTCFELLRLKPINWSDL